MTEETNGRSFDELAKGLANGEVSRRKALGLIGAALVGGTLASIPGMAWAAKPVGGKGCRIAGQTRVNGQCTCPTGTTVCGTQCVNTQTDPNNCGTCGTACSMVLPGSSCVMGSCQCPPSQAICNTGMGSYCADFQTDPNNCGGCGNICPPMTSCVMGGCR